MATPLPSDEGGADGSSSRDAGVDAALVDRIRDGDAEAFGELVRRYMRRAFSISYRVLQHRQDAEDAVQESFIRALDRIDTLERGRPFASWFYRVVVNQALNSRRARSRRTTEAIPAETPTPSLLPDRLAEQGELHTRVKEAVDALPDRQRTIVQLNALEGFSSTEIAEILDLSDGTVRWHLHQARRSLREVLRPLAKEKE